FYTNEASFCLWRRAADSSWQVGDIELPSSQDPDGSGRILRILDGNPHTYKEWAEEYYERHLPLRPIEQVYKHVALTDELVAALNHEIRLPDLLEDIEEIGYPYDLKPD